jgi:aspartyl-tRNA(Asn)/glutamyl-tRNA(Gln) amidotransferase subunit A
VSLASLVDRLRAGETSPTEVTRAYLDRIEALDPGLNHYITVDREGALAEAVDRERSGPEGTLWGVPVAIKDVIDVAGTPTTAASKVLGRATVARADATVVGRLRAAGAVILGKLNTHEFAFGATTSSAWAGPARNPWDPTRICGGSSGGSGGAAAADLAAGTLGTDTAGSIRIPAAVCGVTGVRPTTGRVSSRGVFPVSWTFDTVGPICRSAEDCALMLASIAGHDSADVTTVDVPVPAYRAELRRGIEGLRIGVLAERFETGIVPAIAAAARTAVERLADAGASLEEVRIPELARASVVQQLVMLPEAVSVHRRLMRTQWADYGPDVRARLLAGLLLPSTAYVTGQRARRALYDRVAPIFDRFDLLVSPAFPILPPKIGETTVEIEGISVPYRLAFLDYLSPWSCLGLPALSAPAGFVDGLPVSLAVIGPRFGESAMLRAAHALQQTTDWHEQRPPLPGAAPPAGPGD